MIKKILIGFLLIWSVFTCFTSAAFEETSFKTQEDKMLYLVKKQNEINEEERNLHINLLNIVGICASIAGFFFIFEIHGDEVISKLPREGKKCVLFISASCLLTAISVCGITFFSTPTCKKQNYFDKSMENYITSSKTSENSRELTVLFNLLKDTYEDEKNDWIKHFKTIDEFTYLIGLLTLVSAGYICCVCCAENDSDKNEKHENS